MYTYDDYTKKKQEYGFTPDQISDADDRLAQMNPDAGVALLGYKNDWLTAGNESAKAMAHAAAEDIRSRYGNYMGGGDGGSFTPTGTAEYQDPWEDAINTTVKNLQNRKFTWSPETDPNAKYYTDMYLREGDRAMRDTLGTVAATTGGIPSSYAAAAAAQQRNYYAQQLTDKYPELYQQAFERFMREYDNEYNMLSAYSDLSDMGYGRWGDTQDRNRQARQDAAAAQQTAFENALAEDELALQQGQLDLDIRRFDQDTQMAIKDDAYRWAALIQEGRIAEAEQEYKNSALSLEARDIAMQNAYRMAALAEEGRQFDADNAYKYTALQTERDIAEADRAAEAYLTREQLAVEEALERDKMDANADEVYNNILRTIIGSNTKMSEVAALEALGEDSSALREAIVQAMMASAQNAAASQQEQTTVDPAEIFGLDDGEYPIDDSGEYVTEETEDGTNGGMGRLDMGRILAKAEQGETLTPDEQMIYDRFLRRWYGDITAK